MLAIFQRATLVGLFLASAALAGCASNQQPTGAIEPPTQLSSSAAAADPNAPAGAQVASANAAVMAKPTPLALATVDSMGCDQIQAEVDGYKTDGTSAKLVKFGQAKYQPTPAEQSSFSRLVSLRQGFSANCKTAGKVAKKTMKPAATAIAPTASMVKTKALPAAKAGAPADTKIAPAG